mmetsp:Transcript_67530/g.175843  ORF Transcript_67530/g.175843 Transcript_67530/m.175843 type:complete len:309 (-) Transcript_67530:180-1106(-)
MTDAAAQALLVLLGAARAQHEVLVVRADLHVAALALPEPRLNFLPLLPGVVSAAIHWLRRRLRRRLAGLPRGLGGLRDGGPARPAAPAHGREQGPGQAAVGLQGEVLHDEVGRGGRVEVVGVASGRPAEHALPEGNHHGGADGVGHPTLLDLPEDLHLVGAAVERAGRPEHRPRRSGPAPAGALLPHLAEDLPHQSLTQPSPQRLRALPHLRGLAADLHRPVSQLADEDEPRAVGRHVQEQQRLVEALVGARALHRAHLPDLRRPRGPHELQVVGFVCVQLYLLWGLDHQHDVAHQAAVGAQLPQPSG